MPITLTAALVLVPALLFAARFLSKKLPWGKYARRSSRVDVTLLVIGVIGLVLHCVAMFYRSILAVIPGTDGYIAAVNAMGPASVVLYVVPALLVLIGLRRQRPVALVIVAVTLVAVCVTMYNGGPLSIHLVTIAAATVAIAGTAALLVKRPPDRHKPAVA
ncbi:hypothetical protein GCM10022200_25890 [Microbacterium awajiense]|uniref:Uncharacterized protein n=1 Tax=Microbacterium awajiense TaxID=415214 RepID=A0ABP7AVM2_9MICO